MSEAEFVAAVLTLYADLPDTPLRPTPTDQVTARRLLADELAGESMTAQSVFEIVERYSVSFRQGCKTPCAPVSVRQPEPRWSRGSSRASTQPAWPAVRRRCLSCQASHNFTDNPLRLSPGCAAISCRMNSRSEPVRVRPR